MFYNWRNLLTEFLFFSSSFYLHCLHIIRIVLTLYSKVIYDNEVTCSVLDAVRFIFFCTVCLMLLTAIEMS